MNISSASGTTTSTGSTASSNSSSHTTSTCANAIGYATVSSEGRFDIRV